MAEAAEAQGACRNREEAKRKAAGGWNYAEALDVYNPGATGTTSRQWRSSWDGTMPSTARPHRTCRLLTSILRTLNTCAKGYDAGAAWLQSDDGQALLNGGGKKSRASATDCAGSARSDACAASRGMSA